MPLYPPASSSAIQDKSAQLASDFNTLSTTFVDITGFTFSTIAGASYYFWLTGPMQTSATSVGAQLSMNHSTAVTSINILTKIPNATTPAWTFTQSTSLDAGAATANGPGSTSIEAWIEGIVVINTAGTLAFRFKSETAAGATLLAGTTCLLVRIS